MLDAMIIPQPMIGEYHGELYRPLLRRVLFHGEEITVRGRPTREILNNICGVKDPRKRVISVPGRRWNPWLAMSEGLWIIAGRNDIASLKPYNSRITEFSDDGIVNYGAYGYRIKKQMDALIKLLRTDRETRRAVLSIYTPEDAGVSSKDIPCNVTLLFKIRNNELHLVVVNRSNDIHWGLFAVNFCQFSMLQECVAACVSAEMGTQIHFSHSLHVYTDDVAQAITDKMGDPLRDMAHNLEPYSEATPRRMFSKGLPENWEYVQWYADYALGNGSKPHNISPFFSFARAFLRLYRLPTKAARMEAYPSFMNEFMGYGFNDWLQAGKDFLWSDNPVS